MIRDVIAIDGEAVTEGDKHLYTLLCAYDSHHGSHSPRGRWREIDAWDAARYPEGITTERILSFLLRLPKGRRSIVCGFFLNYDVAMWLKGLSDRERAALWKSGYVHWYAAYDPSPRAYYIRWIPSKLFFVGEWSPDTPPDADMYSWPGRSLLIYDVSGFSQRSFVSTMEGWETSVNLTEIARNKAKRGLFTRAEKDIITSYCRDECVALAEYIQQLDAVFREEGIELNSWHGGGAVASFYLKRADVGAVIRDTGGEEVYRASLHAYFGGRNEIQQMGRLSSVYDYDLSSAYVAALPALPNLVSGRWEGAHTYEPDAAYALWHVEWSVTDAGKHLGPLPFRYRGGVYYPRAGAGWVHAVELDGAIRHFGAGAFRVTGGLVYRDGDTGMGMGGRPLAFVEALARRRVAYKTTDAKRAIPLKLGTNSMYGKLAQHATEDGRLPPYQCYYAAGYVTAWTRAHLLDLIYADGADDTDVVLLATDGVFCLRPRTWEVVPSGDELGKFSLAGILDEAVFIQPGCWYASDGTTRSRGFGKHVLSYKKVGREWDTADIYGILHYRERRFVGLGYCSSTGDWSQYATWPKRRRQLVFYPERKFPGERLGPHAIRLEPMSFAGLESEAFTPHAIHSTAWADEALADLLARWYGEDQPDYE